MLILRIFAGLLFLALGISLVMYIANGERRWLKFAGQMLGLGLAILLIIFLFLIFERLALVA